MNKDRVTQVTTDEEVSQYDQILRVKSIDSEQLELLGFLNAQDYQQREINYSMAKLEGTGDKRDVQNEYQK